MSTDAIVLLKDDHKEIKKVFRAFQNAGENATKAKGDLVKQMIELLTVHTCIENEVMYPEVRRLLPGAERFDAKTTVLIENVTHHIDEEENDWFPQVRAGLGRKQLSELGRQLLAAKEKAPRTPAAPSALKKTVDAIIR